MFYSRSTGLEYETLREAFSAFCGSRNCTQCPFDEFIDSHPEIDDCNDIVEMLPDEAMRIMDVVEKEDEPFEFNEAEFKSMLGLGK